MHTPDDAAVWRIDEEKAIIITTDFFTPVVDDPYDYGAIAAANSLSDVYAMGGQPFLALNIAALPPDLPHQMLAEIFRGGAEMTRQAGVIIAGGHSVQDREPKYGLVVVGFAHPGKLISKGGARVGDRLVLTKPLGFGVTTTALKQKLAEPQDVAEAVGWMKQLNRAASSLAVDLGLQGGTDITGFSLLGHGMEMADASGVSLRFHFDSIPFIGCARKYADQWTFPGGASDNALYFSPGVNFSRHLGEADRMLLFDPQTSGGLLLAVPESRLSAFLGQAQKLGQSAWEVGEVVAGRGVQVD